MTPVADDVATADVPSPRAAKKQKMRTTSQLSELCGLDDVLDAPHAPRESSAAAAASTYETPVRYPASAAPAGAPIRDVDTDDKPHQPSLHRASGGSSDVSTLVSPAGGAAPPGIVRHGSLPKNLHINIPRASVGSGASEDTNADAADADADAAASERVPPVTPATAFTAVPLHAAVAAGRVEDVRLWLEEHAPVDSRDVDDGVGESDRNGNGNDDVVASTPEWPPRPVRDILGPESVSREPPESSDGKLPARPVVRGIPGRRAPRASVRVRDSDRSSGGDLGARGGGPVDARNEHGNAALAVAAALSDAAVSATLTRLLLTHGASPLVLSSGWTPLHWAAQEGNVESLEAMAAWEGGRAVDARCEAFGRTPLTTAASAGRGACVEALIRAGADALALDVDGAGVLSHVATKVSKGVRSKVRAATRSALLAAAPKLKVLLLHHEDCGKHVSFKPHQESPERIAAVLASLAKGAASGALAEDEVSVSSEFEPATATHLARAHGEEYIGMITDLAERVANTPVAFTPYHQEFKGMPQAKQKKPEFSDTFFSPGTMTAALRAAGGVVHAVEKVLRGERRTAFVCVRPPGHHAGVNGATAGAPSAGFSILNNAMIGASRRSRFFSSFRHASRASLVFVRSAPRGGCPRVAVRNFVAGASATTRTSPRGTFRPPKCTSVSDDWRRGDHVALGQIRAAHPNARSIARYSILPLERSVDV